MTARRRPGAHAHEPLWSCLQPFGEGVLTVGRGERCMQLWSLYDHLTPIYTLQGHSETIESFEWRYAQTVPALGMKVC
jgi:hypothetical protein